MCSAFKVLRTPQEHGLRLRPRRVVFVFPEGPHARGLAGHRAGLSQLRPGGVSRGPFLVPNHGVCLSWGRADPTGAGRAGITSVT